MKKINLESVLTKEYLYTELIVNQRKVTEIAEQYKVSVGPVWQLLRKYGISNIRRERFVNQKFNNATVKYATDERDKRGRTIYICQCVCGSQFKRTVDNLRKCQNNSCGCIKRRRKKSLAKLYKEMPYSYFNSIKSGAKRRGIHFNITIEYLWDLFIKQNGRCKLSNYSLKLSSNSYNMTASLDRIDSNKGYIADNLQWLHKDIHRIKMDLNQNDLINYCTDITFNLNPEGKILF